MLNRQYGVAASSSIVKVAHPEDSQPNERIQGRNRNLPPKLNTVRPPRFSRSNATNSSRPVTQLARRGTWKTRLPTRSRQESSFSSNAGGSGSRFNPTYVALEAPTSRPTSLSSVRRASHPAPKSTSSTWVARYKSISPILPPEPIRRRTPLDALGSKGQPADGPPPPRRHSPIPLPGRKRKPKEAPPSDPSPSQKLKVEQPKPLLSDIKDEPSSPASITTSRKLVKEACGFWPTPDNCRKSHSGYLENRREFARAKNKELVNLGLKRKRAFFREDGLVIEWRSEVPVWNDTLLPEMSQSQSATLPETNPSGLSPDDSNSEILKRKRDVIEIVDVDALRTETPPSKRPRPSDPGPATSAQKSSGSKPSPKKGKIPEKHWSAGLSMEDIRELGRGVEAASLKPPPPSLMPPNSYDAKASAIASITPVSSPSKRHALPTRLTPSERKAISASYSTTTRHTTTAPSSPERDKETRPILDTTPTSSDRLRVSAPTIPDTGRESVQPPFNNDASLPPVLGEMVAPPGAEEVLNAQVDTSASNVGAALTRDDEAQHLDSIFGCDDVAQIPPPVRNSENLKHDERALFEVESQEIERLCTEDNSVDLPEYEMAEDFLRQFINFFDADRNELEMAYSNDALLSCRVPSTEPGIPVPSTSSKSTLHVGRTEIIDKLNSLTGYHFSPVGVPSNAINYDIAVLSQEVINFGIADDDSIDKGAVGGVLATLHSQINRSDSGLDRAMMLHQSFVLRRRTELDDSGLEGSTSKLSWPLVVISHHMVLREEPPDQPSLHRSQHGSP